MLQFSLTPLLNPFLYRWKIKDEEEEEEEKEEEEEEEEEEPLLIYTAQGSPFRCKKLSAINGSPEDNKALKTWYICALQ